MKAIGGYFELALDKGGHHYHDTPYVMKSGRSALHYILTIIKPGLVFIPFYSCDSLLEPFKVAGINYAFYSIDENFEPTTSIELKPGEYFLYINYFDLKGDTVGRLSEKYKDKLIVDCTQAFFMKGNGASWYFNSCRKFFGVPDGSFLYAPAGAEIYVTDTQNEDYIIEHLLKRFNGHANEGYDFFVQNECLINSSITGISKLSEHLLSKINYEEALDKRQKNYDFLHEKLNRYNKYNAERKDNSVPMSYPLLLDAAVDKRSLFTENIFVPVFWKDIFNRGIEGFEFEKRIANNLLPLPIDHRYSFTDMETIFRSLVNIIP